MTTKGGPASGGPEPGDPEPTGPADRIDHLAGPVTEDQENPGPDAPGYAGLATFCGLPWLPGPADLAQARNAVALARLAGADRHASDTFAKAENLLATAEQAREKRQNSNNIMQPARQAAASAHSSAVPRFFSFSSQGRPIELSPRGASGSGRTSHAISPRPRWWDEAGGSPAASGSPAISLSGPVGGRPRSRGTSGFRVRFVSACHAESFWGR